ncbi:ParB/RepB/Spo0J family partition protein [Castellaniella sp.]|uniref:ParB/RepB/Spo0J family partition protein n=2 Tax=Castellaniella sp. TaxID=1955812 RepID=UPI002AFF2F9D|nr:ParB/RepB/Spo0J family partition protein [Castellaniella sp.]
MKESGANGLLRSQMGIIMTNGTTPGTIETIALSKLIPSPANVRRARSEAGITELAASLLAHGQIQNLTVRKGAKGKFEVVAGARRLAAFNMLAKEAKITKEHGILCNVITDADDAEISLAENIVRERMGVVDEVTAFRALADKGQPAEEIAARFGISVITVRRRLKLAHLSPRILEAISAGEINLEQAEALALSDDHAEQEAAWFNANAYYGREPRAIRETLSRESVRADHKLARYVGLEAYEQAGGTLTRDLFVDKNDAYFNDRPLLTRLATEKLNALAAVHKANGWGWAEPDIEGNAGHSGGFKHIHHTIIEMSPEVAAERAALQDESDALAQKIENEDGTEEENRAAEIRYEEIDQRLSQIEAEHTRYRAEEMAHAGCIISLTYEGQVRVLEGMVRPQDWKAIMALRSGADVEQGTDDGAEAGESIEDEDTGPALPAVLVEELTAQRTAALRIELASSPTVALAAALHPLLIRLFYKNEMGYASFNSAVELRGEQQSLTQAIQKPEENPVLNAWDTLLDQTRKSLPIEVEGLWDWLNERPLTSLLDLMALVSAANLNAIQFRHEKKRTTRIDRADEIARAIYFDMKKYFKADEAFYERLSKKQLGEVMASEGADAEAVASMMKLPKYEAVHRTMAMMPMDYVPSCIQTRELLDDEDEVQDIAAE